MKMYFLQKKILKLLYSALIFFAFTNVALAVKSNYGLDGFIENKIDASKNARLHSNMGNIYFEEKNYQAALKEYEIAFNISNKNQTSGVYLYNIARCHFVMGNYEFAKKAVLGAINKDCINMTYYEFLVDCFIKLNKAEFELDKYINDTTNPYNRIVVGLIYLKTNRKMQARATFDDFIANYPKMLITDDIRLLINKI